MPENRDVSRRLHHLPRTFLGFAITVFYLVNIHYIDQDTLSTVPGHLVPGDCSVTPTPPLEQQALETGV